MKLTNQQIKEAYEAEGGPELHPNRETDTGLTTGDFMRGLIFLIILTAILVRLM